MVKIIPEDKENDEYECDRVEFHGNYLMAFTSGQEGEKVRHRAKVFDLLEVDEIQYF